MTIKIKVLESGYPEILEERVNDFLNVLEYEPLRITFSNSFETVSDDNRVEYYPRYTAIIEYYAAPKNVEAVAAYEAMMK